MGPSPGLTLIATAFAKTTRSRHPIQIPRLEFGRRPQAHTIVARHPGAGDALEAGMGVQVNKAAFWWGCCHRALPAITAPGSRAPWSQAQEREERQTELTYARKASPLILEEQPRHARSCASGSRQERKFGLGWPHRQSPRDRNPFR